MKLTKKAIEAGKERLKQMSNSYRLVSSLQGEEAIKRYDEISVFHGFASDRSPIISRELILECG